MSVVRLLLALAILPRVALADGARIDVRLVSNGQLIEVELVGERLTVRGGSRNPTRERSASVEEVARLDGAARAALRSDESRRSCGDRKETFVSLTAFGKTASTAVCPKLAQGDDGYEVWRRLLDVTMQLAAGGG